MACTPPGAPHWVGGATTTTDADGRFRFELSEPVARDLHGDWFATTAVPAGGGPVELVAPFRDVALTAVDPEGAAVPLVAEGSELEDVAAGAVVARVRSADAGAGADALDPVALDPVALDPVAREDGALVHRLRPGTAYAVDLWAPDRAPLGAGFTVPTDGGPPRVVFAVGARTTPAQVRVALSGLESLRSGPCFRVEVVDPSTGQVVRSHGGSIHAVAAGEGIALALPAGTWWIRGETRRAWSCGNCGPRPPRAVARPVDVRLAPGDSLPVRLVFEESARLRFDVVDPEALVERLDAFAPDAGRGTRDAPAAAGRCSPACGWSPVRSTPDRRARSGSGAWSAVATTRTATGWSG